MTERGTALSIAPDSGLPLREGDVLAGKYQVGRILGRGGVGIVIAATHLLLQQKVAIKLLSKPGSPDLVGRFLREGQAAARLKGEHVARVLDMGQLPDGAPFMVLEYLEGHDLGAVIEQRGALPVEESVEYVLHACEAMAEAHAAGIVHRDLKPANLFLTTTADGTKRVKVVDFGISKDFDGPIDHRLTSTTTVIGSPLYMSPEQMRSARETDARSDIWALGVILYELLTAHTPFDAELYSDLVLKVATRAPPPPSTLRRDLPPRLESVILRCLEKSADRRYPDVEQLAAALVPFGPPSARGALERICRLLDAAPASRASLMPGRVSSASRASMASVAPMASAAPETPGGAPQPRADSAWAMTGQSSRQRRGRQAVLAVAAGGLTAAIAIAAVLVARREPPVAGGIAPAPVEERAAALAPSPSATAREPAGPAVVEPSGRDADALPPTATSTAEAGRVAPAQAQATAATPPTLTRATAFSGRARPTTPAAVAPPEPAPAARPPAPSKNPLDLGIK